MAEYIEREDTINSKPEGRNPEQSGKEEYNKGWNDCRRYFVRIIESQPAADVAPVVHGYWCKELVPFRDKLGNQHFGSCCSKCGGIFDRTKFCGGCGAKMDGKEHNNV